MTAGPPAAFNGRLIAPLILGSILNPVNSSIIAVSLVPIGRAFDAPSSSTAWLISALYLATAIGQPVVGRLVDTLGPRRLFLAGATLTGLAGITGTLAPSLGVLVAARVILGLGTCAGYPAAMYLIRSEAERTGRDSPGSILTALAVANQTIAVIGPPVGGLLIGLGGWRMTLAVNIPLATACVALGVARLPKTTARQSRSGDGLDLLGIALFAAMLVSLLLFLMEAHAATLWLLAVSTVCGGALAARELRADDPFIDLRILRANLPLVRTYARNLLAMTVTYAFLYGFTQWAEDARGLSASEAGLVLLPMPLTAIAVSSATGRSPQLRRKLLAGAGTQALACLLLLTLDAGSALWLLLVVAAVMGVPQGLNSLANQNAVYRQADAQRIGASAGLLRTFAYLGAIIASAATGALFGRHADTAGLHSLTMLLIAVAVAFLALTLFDRSLARVY